MEQSVDALSLKDVQLGLENGQKPMSGKSDSGHSSQGCYIFGFMKKRFNFEMSKPKVLFIFCI